MIGLAGPGQDDFFVLTDTTSDLLAFDVDMGNREREKKKGGGGGGGVW